MPIQDNFQNTYLGGILIAVAFLNAFIEFFQLQKSEAILASFLAMIPPSCHVVRDGSITSVPAADLVKGDVVLLVGTALSIDVSGFSCTDTCAQRTGDKTPADLIIFAATDLKVDNSNLTGESEAQERLGVPDGSKHRPVEAENLVRTSYCPFHIRKIDFVDRSSTPLWSSTVKDGVSSSAQAITHSSAKLQLLLVARQATRAHSPSKCQSPYLLDLRVSSGSRIS